MHAVDRGSLKLVEELVKVKGLEINYNTPLGYNALLRAGYNQDGPMVLLLSKNGGQINEEKLKDNIVLKVMAENCRKLMRG